jgi:hypothetical protein
MSESCKVRVVLREQAVRVLVCLPPEPVAEPEPQPDPTDEENLDQWFVAVL